ncbi:MAG TPA: VanZ family protein [Paenibacillus sp.]
METRFGRSKFILRGASFVNVFILSLSLSLCFEVTQLLLFIGIFDVDDLILNTSGGIVGCGVLRLFMTRNKPRSHESLVFSPSSR